MQNTYTLGEWLQRWIDFYAPVRCKSGVTLERYQRLANYVLEGTTLELGESCKTLLAHLTHQQLESSLLSLLHAPAKRKERLSAKTVRHLGGLLSVALGKALRLDLVKSNPMHQVELPNGECSHARSLTLDEVRKLLRVCAGDWTRTFTELALSTGLRRGELLALTWADINRRTRVLSVSKSLEETKRGLKIKYPKNGRPRSCTLPKSTMKLLPQYNEHGELNEGLIFPGDDGRWRIPALVSQTIIRRLHKAGIRKASLHSLRHTHASQLLSRGLPVPAVSARLGHSDPAVTMRIYAHALPLDDRRVADEWDRLMSGV